MTKTVCIFGGTGFIGSRIISRLARDGWRIRIATRNPKQIYRLKLCGAVGQITAKFYDTNKLHDVIDGCDAVINCIGILYEKRQQTFEKLHTDFPEQLAKAVKDKGVKSFIHISALGVDTATSKYAQSKLDGEKRIKKIIPNVTILRPSVVFGPDDGFINLFAGLSKILPVLPLIGGGHTKFQPVYVGDVADAVIAALDMNETRGKTYELGGPEVLTFKNILEKIGEYTGRHRLLVPIPFWLAKAEAFFLQMYPKPLLTVDQVESLKSDNVVTKKASGLGNLGIKPASMNQIVPRYIR